MTGTASSKRPVYTQNIIPPSSGSQAPPIAPPTTGPSSYAPPTNPPLVAPPTYSQAPPTYSQAPPTHSQAPSSYSQAPPLTVEKPSILPVQAHWFYLKEGQEYWYPFSLIDSSKLEEIYIRLETDSSFNVR